MTRKRKNLCRIAIGVGFCPFDWRIGDASLGWLDTQSLWAFGPFRLSWRGW